jgi:ribosomal protein S12 methylthiotransferase accessory factor
MTTPGFSDASIKVFTTGTHRVRHPDETWDLVVPKMVMFGITRVADITGLDTIGIPVSMATRPRSKSLSVSQGKGQTLRLAKVSALMEAVELWHVEYAIPAPTHLGVPAEDLSLPYSVETVTIETEGLITGRTPLDWLVAYGLISGRPTPVPREAVCFESPNERRWLPPGFLHTSNGLASGNSMAEAALHALYEIIERDSVARLPPDSLGQPIDPATVDDDGCSELIDRIRAAGVTLTLCRMSSPFPVSCMAAQVWSPDFPVRSIGYGAHLEPAVAASRAITEAAQSRLTTIAGSRDDLPDIYDHVRRGTSGPSAAPDFDLTWPEISTPPRSFEDVADELAWVASQVEVECRQEPLLIDLSTDDDIAVVRMIVPGIALDLDRLH